MTVVALCCLAKDFKGSYLIKPALDLVSHGDDNSIHKLCLICRVLLAVWKFSEAHLPPSLWQSLDLCSFGEQSGVDSQGRLVCNLQVNLTHLYKDEWRQTKSLLSCGVVLHVLCSVCAG